MILKPVRSHHWLTSFVNYIQTNLYLKAKGLFKLSTIDIRSRLIPIRGFQKY